VKVPMGPGTLGPLDVDVADVFAVDEELDVTITRH
jgi:hypothetical protein